MRKGLNSLEKMLCLFTNQLYHTSFIPCLLISSISSATHCFPFFTFHFDFTANSVFSIIFFPWNSDSSHLWYLDRGLKSLARKYTLGSGIYNSGLYLPTATLNCIKDFHSQLLFLSLFPWNVSKHDGFVDAVRVVWPLPTLGMQIG